MDSTSTMRTDTTSPNGHRQLHHSNEGPSQNDVSQHDKSSSRNVHNHPSATLSTTPQSVLDHLYGPIAESLVDIESRLCEQLQSPYEALAPLLRHGTQLGGKRLRPAMMLLAASAVGSIQESHLVLGTVIEMVHTATLVHDDVLDEASTRRHVPTINALHDNHTSILLGDYLFAQAFRLTATLDDIAACRWIGDAAKDVCVGELRQVLDRNMIDLDEETYLDILRGKTAELCCVACRLGAKHAGGSDVVVDAMAEFGNSIGIAFQIADDYLDLWGDDETVGKTLGTDLEQGKITLPLIRLLDTCDESDRDEIVSIITGPSDQRVEAIRPWLGRSDAKAYTAATAERYRDAALSSLDILDDSPSKECLIAIANFAIDRRF